MALTVAAPNNQPVITGVGNATPGTISSVGNANGSQMVNLLPSSNSTTTNTPTITGGGGGTTSTGTPIAQSTIDAVMAAIAGAIAQNQAAFGTAQTENANADQSAANTYNQQQTQNTTTRAQAVQNAETAAAQGNQGLKAVLASLGALNGTGQILAGRAVANTANGDIGGADTTYATNNQAIQNAKDAYDTQKIERDQALQSNLNTDNADARASGIQNLLNDAEAQGDVATYNKYLPQLVRATTAQTQVPLAARLIPANAATTASYAPTSSLNVTTAPSQPGASTKAPVVPVNSALYVNKTH